MNDLKIRPVKIVLDRERNLVMDLNAYEELENIYESEPPIFRTDEEGNSTEVDSLLGKAFEYLAADKKKIKHLKNFLFAGLVHEDRSLTPAKVGTMIGATNIADLTDYIWKAVAMAQPDPKEGGEASSGE